MNITFFSAKPYDKKSFNAIPHNHHIQYYKDHLSQESAHLAAGSQAVCVFVNDELPRPCLEKLHHLGIKFIVLRCAGFNNIDLQAAAELGILVARVPAYSPHAVAEHAVAMLLTLNRKTHRAYNRVREGNFEIDGLLGIDLYHKTVGIFGAGKIGICFAKIMHGFGCQVLISDPQPSQECLELKTTLGIEIVSPERIFAEADIVSLHCPLLDSTHHLYNADTLAKSKPGLILINTSRGGLVDAKAAIQALKSGHLGYLGMDVYEDERDFFFQDFSSGIVQDDTLMRLMTFPNVLITGHQAFFTKEALKNIAETTLQNLTHFQNNTPTPNQVTTK
ncbi:MAG: 2-hydroxyacid dehydrogenase [Akkermansiaceae bacterium]